MGRQAEQQVGRGRGRSGVNTTLSPRRIAELLAATLIWGREIWKQILTNFSIMGGRQERFINSLSFQFLTRTLELDLSNIHGRGMFPNKKDIHSFIMDEMGIKAGMLRGVQHHPRFPKVHLQFINEVDLQAAEIKVKDGLLMKSKKIKIFGYRCDKPMISMTLNGQDMDVEEEEIRRVLGKHGLVVTCERGRNVDLSTSEHFVTDGTWTIRMTPDMRKKPPETIYYFGPSGSVSTWILTYDGVGSSCILCGLQGHMGFRCNSLAPRNGIGKEPAGLGKWTEVVKCPPPAVQRPSLPGPGDQQGGDVPGVPPVGGEQGRQVRHIDEVAQEFLDELEEENGSGKQANIPGLPKTQPWTARQIKNKKKRENRKLKKRLEAGAEGVKIANKYDALSDNAEDSWDDDTDDEVEEKEKQVLVRRVSSILGGYGSRRVVSVATLFKKKVAVVQADKGKVSKKNKGSQKTGADKRKNSYSQRVEKAKKTRISWLAQTESKQAETAGKDDVNKVVAEEGDTGAGITGSGSEVPELPAINDQEPAKHQDGVDDDDNGIAKDNDDLNTGNDDDVTAKGGGDTDEMSESDVEKDVANSTRGDLEEVGNVVTMEDKEDSLNVISQNLLVGEQGESQTDGGDITQADCVVTTLLSIEHSGGLATQAGGEVQTQATQASGGDHTQASQVSGSLLDNRTGYAQDMGAFQFGESVTTSSMGGGGESQDNDNASSPRIITEEELEVKLASERINSEMREQKSSSTNSEDGL